VQRAEEAHAMEPFPPPDIPGLRPWRPDDAPALVAAWADPDIVRWCGVPPDVGPARADAWIAGWEERRGSGAALDLVAERDSAVAGEVGLAPFRGTVTDVVELGWWVLPAHRGHGLARAMVAAVVGWATEAMPGRRLVARIPPGHAASERVASAAGLERAGRLDESHDLWRPKRSGRPRVR
jgi:[ribosomal protein S5]-alanine N-acetyltransferase